jgi:glucokinase
VIEQWQVRGTEGSHSDFAASDGREWRLRQSLSECHGHVSWERVVSGPGLRLLFDHLVDVEGMRGEPELLKSFEALDPSAAIAEAALKHGDPTAREALNWFLSLLGAEAGNHALKVMATGGVFVAGGIPPKISDAFSADNFLRSFFDKGRMAYLMRRMPVYLVLDEKVALYGAAAYAAADSR